MIQSISLDQFQLLRHEIKWQDGEQIGNVLWQSTSHSKPSLLTKLSDGRETVHIVLDLDTMTFEPYHNLSAARLHAHLWPNGIIRMLVLANPR